jgi:hypothetical protein
VTFSAVLVLGGILGGIVVAMRRANSRRAPTSSAVTNESASTSLPVPLEGAPPPASGAQTGTAPEGGAGVTGTTQGWGIPDWQSMTGGSDWGNMAGSYGGGSTGGSTGGGGYPTAPEGKTT